MTTPPRSTLQQAAAYGWSNRWTGAWTLMAVLIAGAMSAGIRAFTGPLASIGMQEDAMIGLRHLRSLIEGHGLVYNPGQGVVGATDPLFWLGSGLAFLVRRLLGGSADLVAHHYHYLWLVASAALLLLLLRSTPFRMALGALLAALGWALFFEPLRFMFLGLEGPFLLLSLGVLAWVHRWASPAAFYFVASLLSWNRPEIAVIALPVLAFYALRRREQLPWWRALAPVVLGGATVPLLLWAFSGAPVVQTVLAKSYFEVSSIPAGLPSRLRHRFTELDGFLGVRAYGWAALSVLVVTLALGDLWKSLRAPPVATPVLPLFSIFCAGYTAFILFVPYAWSWYITYWLGFVLVLGCWRGAALLEAAATRWAPARPLAMSVGLVLLTLVTLRVRPTVERVATSCRTWLAQENAFRGRLGRDLESRWKARSVWMEAVGWQGFFNHARVIDEVGLVDSTTPALARKYGCRYFVGAVLELAPQFIVKRRFELEDNRLVTAPSSCPEAPLFVDEGDRALFHARYELVGEYTPEVPNYFGRYSFLQLYRLREPAQEPGASHGRLDGEQGS